MAGSCRENVLESMAVKKLYKGTKDYSRRDYSAVIVLLDVTRGSIVIDILMLYALRGKSERIFYFSCAFYIPPW